MTLTPLLILVLVVVVMIGVAIILAMLKFTITFRIISYLLFSLSALLTVVLYLLPVFYPKLDEGMGIGIFIVFLSAPPLLLFSITNSIIFIRRYQEKIATKIDITFFVLSVGILLYVLKMLASGQF